MTSAPRHRWYLRPVWISLAALSAVVLAIAATVGSYAWQRVAALKSVERTDGYVEFGSPPPWMPQQLVAYWPQWALPVEEITFLDLRRNKLDQLRMLREVKGLELSSCGITDADLAPLVHCRSLKRLNLADNAVGDAGLQHLAGLPLETLDLSETRVTDAGMGAIGGYKRLKVLRLKKTSVGDAGLAQLKDLPLHVLRLSGTRVSNEGLAALGTLPRLEWLDLDDTTVGDSGLAVIATWPHLQCLSLANTRITDAGLVHLNKLPLFSLDLTGTAISDAGLKNLAARPGWTSIDLNGTAVTSSGADKLGKALGLIVFQDPDGRISLTADPAGEHVGR